MSVLYLVVWRPSMQRTPKQSCYTIIICVIWLSPKTTTTTQSRKSEQHTGHYSPTSFGHARERPRLKARLQAKALRTMAQPMLCSEHEDCPSTSVKGPTMSAGMVAFAANGAKTKQNSREARESMTMAK
ncbi:hypothetical protein BJV74DRAFT_797113 [Russula compacta]|nr:hypothetical protein BJV74DRAFT_797113 [Russula compacta]